MYTSVKYALKAFTKLEPLSVVVQTSLPSML